ncbi:MAG: dihydrolipoyl dehydrogenase [Solirubrobacteraceae bacterium]
MSLVEVKVPDIGDFADVPIIEILVAPGDTVAPEDPLVTLESEKATMDVPSPAAGTVRELRVKVDDKVSEGSVLLTLEVAEASAESDAGETDSTPTADAQVLVIGSGPGGYTAAFRAADLGCKTILVERHDTLGGVCLNVGCIPSKALLHAARVIAEAQEMGEHGISFETPKVDLRKLLAFKDGVVGRLTDGLRALAKQRKVEVVTGEARFTGPHSVSVAGREISFENCIIAAGSRAASLPFLPDDPRVIDSTAALSPSAIPKRLLVLGGGIIGLEMATVYDALGSRVTVVEMMDQLIPGCDPDLVKPLRARIEGRYEAIMLGTHVTAVTAQKSGLKVSFSEGDDRTFDGILVAVGRAPNGGALDADKAGVDVDQRGFIGVDAQQRTNVPGIYAIGDITGPPMLAHKATHEAKVAAEVIAGVPGAAFDARAIPAVAFTDPEVAWMGLTETAAREQGVAYAKSVFPWAASGRALGLGRPDGSTKLLWEPESGRLLGAGIVGVNAGDLISELVLALEAGLDAQDIALTIHPHPTLSETVAFAAELQDGSITDLLPPRPRR